MSAAVPIIVVLLLIAVGVGGYYGWRRWVRYKSNKALLDWAGANMEYGRLEEGQGRRSSVNSLTLADVPFATFENRAHGFKVAYPKDWSVNASRSSDNPIVVQFACPQSERTYKTFSVVSILAAAIESAPGGGMCHQRSE